MADPRGDIITPKQNRFIKNLIAGHSKVDSARLAGYSPHSSGAIASQLLKKGPIVKILEEAGLGNKQLADMLQVATTSGLGVKSTNSDALKGIELALRLHGHLDKTPENLTQNNTYINELKVLSIDELQLELARLQAEIEPIAQTEAT